MVEEGEVKKLDGQLGSFAVVVDLAPHRNDFDGKVSMGAWTSTSSTC